MSIDAFLTRVPDKLANDPEVRDYFDQLNRAVSDLTILSQTGTVTTTIETIIAATVDVPVTNAANIGTGVGVFERLNNTILEFNSLIGGDGISIADTVDDVTITADVQGASNIGSGLGVFSALVAGSLEFNSLIAGSGISIADTTDDLTFTADVQGASNIGSGAGLFSGLVGGSLQFDSLIGGTGITITDTTDDLTITSSVNDGTVEDAITHWNNSTNQWDELSEVTMNWAAGVMTMQVEDDGAALQNVLTADADGAVSLYFNSILAALTSADGFSIRDTSGIRPLLNLQDDAGTILSRVQHIGGNQVRLINLEHGDTVNMSAEDAGGTIQTIFQGNPDGASIFSFAGITTMRTTSTGMQVRDTSGAIPLIELQDDGGTSLSILRHVGASRADWRSIEHGSFMRISGEDAGGSLQTLFEADPDGGTELYEAGTLALTTKSGGVRIDDELEIDGALNHDGSTVGFYGVTPVVQASAYTRNATIVEDRTLLASASATAINNNNVIAALIADLQALGFIA